MSAIKRVFSGIQPSGVPHIGNYVGAIKNWVKLQNHVTGDRSSKLFCVVDLHALTVKTEPKALNENITKMVASLLASGISLEKSIIFQQSKVPYHAELCWYLSCLAPTGQLKRMHQWKTKLANKETDEANLGLFSYPVLMSADVLLYKATHVPVGDDQTQHIELTRDLVNIFNKKYSHHVFPMPEVLLSQAPRVMNLRNPKQKMSKSDININSRIDISDSDDVIAKKIKKTMTDSEPYLDFNLENRDGVRNLITIYSAFTDYSEHDIIGKYSNIKYFTKQLKEDLTDIIVHELTPVRKQYEELLADKNYLKSVLGKGNMEAGELAEKTIKEVHSAMGLTY